MSKTVAALATPHGIRAEDREKIAQALNPLVANALALYLKTKAFHWHVYGPHFRDYHLLLDEQAAEILAMVDVLAERVRKLGKTTLRGIGDIQKQKTIEDTKEFLAPEEMLEVLREDNKKLASQLGKAHEVCSKAKDYASTSILEIFLDETERRVWFLFECGTFKN